MKHSLLINENELVQKKLRFTPIGYTKYLKGLKKSYLMFRQGLSTTKYSSKILSNCARQHYYCAKGLFH